MPPGGSSSIPLLVKPTVPGPLVTSGTVTAGGEQNTANNGPANTTITVVRTCAVYNGDGSSFPCGTSATPNSENSQSTNPSNAICCVSLLDHPKRLKEFANCTAEQQLWAGLCHIVPVS
jgi:hypothetical protein